MNPTVPSAVSAPVAGGDWKQTSGAPVARASLGEPRRREGRAGHAEEDDVARPGRGDDGNPVEP